MRTHPSFLPLHPWPHGVVTAPEALVIIVVITGAVLLATAGLPLFGITEFLTAVLYLVCRALLALRVGRPQPLPIV
ncbi:hypothetical protein [Streptomyces sp. YS-3]|uniref:hypothetical protein n=1 Tax=Streptomyces sp. YS-3 TaxID=3381352 RepID=UPI003862533E